MAVLLALAIALVIDFAVGEPPRAIHPVVGMGRLISCLVGRVSARSPRVRFACGCGITLLTVAVFAVPAYFLLSFLGNTSLVAYVIVGALLLKSTFSLRELRRVALGIKELLENGKLDEVRSGLRALVSRDTTKLSTPLLVSAAVESTAESACDGFVAPLFFFLLFGVPGALAYRCVNTLDSMIGYHGEYEYLGKFPSRMDDGLNYIPARMTALLIVLAAFLSGRDGRRAWQVALADHGRTESPNAGWPMAAAAGALGVRLDKVGQYHLGMMDNPLVPGTIGGAVKLVGVAAAVWMLVCYAVEV
ncbi:MAG: cobalamin biosynthesis protein, partial [Dehalococcoidales bacterium]|nr:cobalamin biosynthesis protein [Dehalococcoidales bacterium]